MSMRGEDDSRERTLLRPVHGDDITIGWRTVGGGTRHQNDYLEASNRGGPRP